MSLPHDRVERTSGHILNLMTNDVARFDMVSVFANWVWSAPLLTAVVSGILYARVGWPPLIGIGIILAVVPLQSEKVPLIPQIEINGRLPPQLGYLGTLSSRIQLRTAEKTDERLGLVTELITGAQMIKMFAWEKWIQGRILKVRDEELVMIRDSGFIRGVYMTLSLFVTRLMVFSTLLALCLAPEQSLTTANVFMISSYYTIIAHAMGQMFVRGIAELTAVNVSIQRLESFLKAGESAGKSEVPEVKGYVDEKPEVLIDGATAFWSRQMRMIDTKTMLLYKDNPPTLSNINFHCVGQRLVGVAGPVGSGKSSLLQLMLGELTPDNLGRVSVRGRISYSPQEPWILTGSIRENIVFDEPWDESRYQHVLELCGLLEDFKAMPAADRTLTGERGAVLSGGQRARVSLARAIYRRADVYLLDDPQSSVDQRLGRNLFEHIFGPGGFLKNSLRILVTHQLDNLQRMDWVVVMENVRGREA